MTLNSVAPVCPPVMRLPASTRLSEMRPAIGRADLGPFEIELGLFQGGVGGGELAGGVALN